MESASSTWQLDSALRCRCLLATTNPDCQWVACPDPGQPAGFHFKAANAAYPGLAHRFENQHDALPP